MIRIVNIFYRLLIIIILSNNLLFAQFGNPVQGHVPSKERGDPRIRTHTQLEGNRVRASIFNFLLTGRENGDFPIDVQTPFEWPKNTGEVYLALGAVIIGGEVTDNAGQVQHIIETPAYRTSPEGRSWNFEPVPGYSNPESNSLANSLESSTWPSIWPDKINDPSDPGWQGSWNGYFGKNIFNADQELFAKASDDRYDRYANYFPDTTDLTRKGLGIIFDQRTLAWSQILIQDDVFLLYTLKNDGTKDIPKMGVTIWFADFVGGNGDSNDDIADFDILGRFLWSRDSDNRAPDFGNDPVGAVAVTFLETPGNSIDRIDNDGDGEIGGPKVTEDLLQGEISDNGIDDNANGLIDENQTHIQFGTQTGTTYANGLDDNNNGESGSPEVIQTMVDASAGDRWQRWPANPETDQIQQGKVHLIGLTQQDLNKKFKNYIDDNDNGETQSPIVTQAMIDQAAADAPNYRYRVPNSNIILYMLTQDALGKKYADGKDNDGNKAVDEGMDENIDEMIDESRTNGIDDDGDWNALTDDVGLDGRDETSDLGEGDNNPNTGVGTGRPGEPHIDLTDVKETDQIGITNAQRIPAGGLNINSDAQMWFDFMIPGKYFNPAEVQPGEYDLFVSSSLFPMRAGDVQPFSMAVILVNGPVNDPGGVIRRNEVLKKRSRAQQTYQNNYRFAIAPPAPILTAVPGNNKVTLYWDDAPEKSFDAFLENIGGDGNHFEGYRIYRSSDPAFTDALNITNGQGTPLFLTPLKVFDLKDGIAGYDSLGIDGIHYYLGEDSGLEHSFVDTTVKNGYTYYYAVVSYSKGFTSGGILPAESPIRINFRADGSVVLGPNAARVTPEAAAAGYVSSTLGEIKLVEGATTSTIDYEIVNPNSIKSKHSYYITFQDTLISNPGFPDTLTTKNYTLVDSTENKVLIYQSPYFSDENEQPIIDGFRLNFNNEPRVELDDSTSKWNDPNVPKFAFEKFVAPGGISGELRPNDYKIFFGNVGMDTSVAFSYAGTPFPPEPVNFRVLNTTTNKYLKFGFLELDLTNGKGKLSAKGTRKDRVIFLEPNSQDSLVVTWWFYLFEEPDTSNGFHIPMAGDTAYVNLKKPFLSNDKFSFTSVASAFSQELAKVQLEDIKVVPNPYLASASWENKNPYTTGRGPRSLHFTHLPPKCTIRIFTVNGELVNTIEHESQINNGTEDWNMLSKDNLSISYGVYIYHIEAPGVGEKIGKFAVIK